MRNWSKKIIYIPIIVIVFSTILISHRIFSKLSETNPKQQPIAVNLTKNHGVASDVQYTSNSRRNKHKQPFSRDSIWNLPLRLDAEYEPANLGEAYDISPEINYYIVTKKNDPIVPWYRPKNWGVGRCERGGKQLGNIPVPHDLIVPDATETKTPNNAAAFLQPDGHTLVQLNPLTRCEAGGPVFGYETPATEDIYGQGITGGQGGSGLSSIGGTIRLGELLPDAHPIPHVLKLLVYGRQYLYHQPPGYRWPAIRSDAYAFNDSSDLRYGGNNPNLVMGTLLAIPPNVTVDSLNLETLPGKKLFYTLQNFGGYIVDDTAWDSYAIAVETGVSEEFKQAYGFSFSGNRNQPSPFSQDINKLFQTLAIVTNNSPVKTLNDNAFRQPLAPPLDRN
ncbi:hypothetical protein [Crocosphaera sp.]|uniref:hypothetical protein n=1 Tax=Crocosphaera sp. TaxID=2729996 RepID=UPI003F2560F7|nr:hypothetical protein [Crocosphaera sp.]